MDLVRGAKKGRGLASDQRGFTLIELLVVITIIAILAAILFPVFARAKKSATIRTCASNEKQLAVAMLMYIDDNNNRFPFAGCNGLWSHNTFIKPVGIGGSKTAWEAIEKYVKNDKIRWCPMMATSAYAAGKTWPTVETQYSWSYWYFCPHKGKDPQGNPWVARYPESVLCGYTMSEVGAPSNKPMFGEFNDLHSSKTTTNATLYTMNMAFCDGHVKSYTAVHNDLMKTLYASRDGQPAF